MLIVGPGFKGICAVRAHSEGRRGRRPPVRYLGGVRRPAAPNKGAQQELRMAKDSQGPVKGDFSSPRTGGLFAIDRIVIASCLVPCVHRPMPRNQKFLRS